MLWATRGRCNCSQSGRHRGVVWPIHLRHANHAASETTIQTLVRNRPPFHCRAARSAGQADRARGAWCADAARFCRRGRLRLASRREAVSARRPCQPGGPDVFSRGSTGYVTSCSRTPSASPTGCPPTTRCSGARAAWARARWSRRCTPTSARENSGRRRSSWSRSTARTSRRLPELMVLVRDAPHRFILFCDDLSFDARRHLLQVAEGGAGRRHRGAAGQRHLLRHLQPPPPDAARHDGERALDRHQPERGGRGEGVAVGPLRPVARLPQLQPGRLLRHGAGLCRTLRAGRSATSSCAREALEWATTRGARSGRVAWQFIQDLAGRLWGAASTTAPAARSEVHVSRCCSDSPSG